MTPVTHGKRLLCYTTAAEKKEFNSLRQISMRMAIVQTICDNRFGCHGDYSEWRYEKVLTAGRRVGVECRPAKVADR